MFLSLLGVLHPAPVLKPIFTTTQQSNGLCLFFHWPVGDLHTPQSSTNAFLLEGLIPTATFWIEWISSMQLLAPGPSLRFLLALFQQEQHLVCLLIL
jgi:hypothetical protein